MSTATLAPPEAPSRVALRARLVLRTLLPLLRTIVEERPEVARPFSRTSAVVQVEARCSEAEAIACSGRAGLRLSFESGQLRTSSELDPRPALTLAFADLASLNRFFAGQGGFPRLRGALRHPLLTARFLGLLPRLRLLMPDTPAHTPADRRLKVRLILAMATHAVSQLVRAGHPEASQFARESPERVYQWTVEATGDGAWLRVGRGRSQAGRGVYEGRAPFVLFAFPTIDAAHDVLTARGNQTEAVARGLVRTDGSPEYSRKVSVLLQKVDELLTIG